MDTYTQANRWLSVTTPLGKDVLLLVGIWRQSEWAWGTALAFVVMGTLLDGAGVTFPYLEFGEFGGFLSLGQAVAPTIDWFGAGFLWSWVHLIVIQVPILVLLQAGSSRRWVGIGSAAPAHL